MEKQTVIIITNIILIVVLLSVGLYLFFNYEQAILISSDPCRLCEEKTGGVCLSKMPTFEELQPKPDFSNYPNTIE